MKKRIHGQRATSPHNRLNLPSTLSPGEKHTRIPTLFTPNDWRTLPVLTKPRTARGVTRLLRGKVSEAKSDLDEAISQRGADEENVAVLGPSNKSEGDEW